MIRLGVSHIQVNEYKDVFKVDDDKQVCKVKMKIIQQMIQVERPRGWNVEKIESICEEIKMIEAYNYELKIIGMK